MSYAGIDGPALQTFSAIGKQLDCLNGYGEVDLLREEGQGCLTHMWFGGDWPGYERTRLRVYLDGETQPSIDMEMGMGHGIGYGDASGPWGSEKVGKTGHPSGYYNSYRIPFGNGIRVTAQRDSGSPDGASFWWIVRGTHNLPSPCIAGVRLPATARLRLYTREGLLTEPLEEFELCASPRAGALYMVAMAAASQRNRGDWQDISYLEAIVRAYIDGASTPLPLSSGLEDYFLGTYYFNRGRYANGLAGLTHFDAAQNAFSAYRFHDDDPIFFRHGLRLTCRCGEELNGTMLHDPPPTLFTTYTWVYEW